MSFVNTMVEISPGTKAQETSPPQEARTKETTPAYSPTRPLVSPAEAPLPPPPKKPKLRYLQIRRLTGTTEEMKKRRADRRAAKERAFHSSSEEYGTYFRVNVSDLKEIVWGLTKVNKAKHANKNGLPYIEADGQASRAYNIKEETQSDIAGTTLETRKLRGPS